MLENVTNCSTTPDALLNAPELAEVLDTGRGLSLNALMHFVTDAQDPYGIVSRLLDVLPSGSALALSHCTPDFDPATWQKVTDIYTSAGTPVQFRSQKDVARFFDGLDLLDPGVMVGHRWRPDSEATARTPRSACGPEWASSRSRRGLFGVSEGPGPERVRGLWAVARRTGQGWTGLPRPQPQASRSAPDGLVVASQGRAASRSASASVGVVGAQTGPVDGAHLQFAEPVVLARK